MGVCFLPLIYCLAKDLATQSRLTWLGLPNTSITDVHHHASSGAVSVLSGYLDCEDFYFDTVLEQFYSFRFC